MGPRTARDCGTCSAINRTLCRSSLSVRMCSMRLLFEFKAAITNTSDGRCDENDEHNVHLS
jgi:hypothetical protein